MTEKKERKNNLGNVIVVISGIILFGLVAVSRMTASFDYDYDYDDPGVGQKPMFEMTEEELESQYAMVYCEYRNLEKDSSDYEVLTFISVHDDETIIEAISVSDCDPSVMHLKPGEFIVLAEDEEVENVDIKVDSIDQAFHLTYDVKNRILQCEELKNGKEQLKKMIKKKKKGNI